MFFSSHDRCTVKEESCDHRGEPSPSYGGQYLQQGVIACRPTINKLELQQLVFY